MAPHMALLLPCMPPPRAALAFRPPTTDVRVRRCISDARPSLEQRRWRQMAARATTVMNAAAALPAERPGGRKPDVFAAMDLEERREFYTQLDDA